MVDYDLFLEKIRDIGMDYRWSKMFVKKLKDDEKAFPVENSEIKEWALKRGFYPGRVELYKLNEDNFRDYIPDFQYFMLHPMNNHFRKWLDKTTLKYILNSNGCEDTMPKYYIYVENDGSFTYLMDCPTDIPKNEDFLINLLESEGILAMKPNSGTSGGLGFIKLEKKEGKVYENNKIIPDERLVEIRDSMRNYIITEYCRQHPELNKIWPDSECTLRVIMCKDPKSDRFALPTWSCAVSYARFGTSINGGASNLSSGGVGVGFDFETGKCNNFCIRYKRFTTDGIWQLKQHPDTKIMWSSVTLPNWDHVRKCINNICQQISSLDYLGLDIIITRQGMKLCEINTHPAIDYEQILCGPVLANKKINTFFTNKGLYNYSGESLWKAYMESCK